jgi:hypothetical protein
VARLGMGQFGSESTKGKDLEKLEFGHEEK